MIDSGIAWCHHTINWWWGCTKVSPACQNCYAESLDARFHGRSQDFNGEDLGAVHWGANAPRMIRNFDKVRSEVQRAVNRAKKTGERQRVFVNSMSDFFEDRRDLDEARMEALDMMRCAPECDFLLLTKRPENILDLLSIVEEMAWAAKDMEPGFKNWVSAWLNGNPPANIWLGTTTENQKYADERMPKLMNVPARVRFLSVEPQLGYVDLFSAYTFWKPLVSPGEVGQKIHWVIVGGESGKHIRKVDLSWFVGLRRQCQGAGIAFFAKQLDGTIPGFQDFETFPPQLQVRQFPQVRG